MTKKTLSTRIEEFERKHAGLTRNAKECCIYKVHEQLRDVSEKAYKPVLLAIGPYNNQDSVGNGFMEEYKLRYLQQMLKRTKVSLDTYITTLEILQETARKCYGEHITLNSNEFVEMMVLDGCFIIELFHNYHEMIYWIMEDDPIFQMKWVLPRIARDLLLFENQLPFFVLAKLFEMSESSNALVHNRSENSGEHVDIDEENDGSNVGRLTSIAQIIQTQLIHLALNFFSGFLPFQWNVNASSYNSAEKIKRLLCFAHEALTPSLPSMVCRRLKVGFKFKNVEFEHLLGLIHTTICISLLDSEIDNARESQEAGDKLKMVEIFKHLFGPRKAISHASEFQRLGSQVNMTKTEENWKEIPFGSELRKVGIEFNVAKKFKDKLDEDRRWITIPFDIELQEAGIEFDKAKKFKELFFERNRNKCWKPKPCETRPQMDGVKLNVAEKFKRLLCQINIENWKSIPYGEELRDAGVEFNKAKKFKRLHALREIKQWNVHSATELEEAGIKFKKAEKSNGFSLKFNNGLMEISPLTIEDDTETYLRNLIAYEQYCDRQNGSNNYVFNYVDFMDNLINSSKDVELLRRKGIISNCLGDDEIISTMVNKLGHYINYSTNIYARTSANLNMHCKRRWNVWMAKLRRNYFNSPWALVSFLGAVLLLALAITQTIFSIIN